ncbi:MAG TPA: hypothetical protein VNC78_12895 [Actinomycetota bacterium]|nr:hypothetical protein [Actinomycetota bacterium]
MERIEVIVPGHPPLSVLADELDARLDDADMHLLYWPVFNNTAKGDHRPTGDLGERYEAIYRLEDTEGEASVEAREVLYPFAENGPVGYTPPGQTQRFDRGGRARPIEPGWRPLSEEVVVAIFGSSERVTPSGLLATARRARVGDTSRLWIAAGLTLGLIVSIRRVATRRP